MANGCRLIDAYKLEDLVRSNSARYHHVDDVVAVIAGQPTVDAVEVVRCKDCIYATEEDGDLYCDGPIGIFGTVGFKDFCSCGERRKNG